MKNYLEYFQSGGKNNHYMYLDGDQQKPKLKTKEFIIASDLKDAFNKLKNKLVSYVNVKKSIPKINKNNTSVSNSGTTNPINNFNNGNSGILGLPASFVYSDINSDSGI